MLFVPPPTPMCWSLPTVRPVRSIWWEAGFVQAGNRRLESIRGLGMLGVGRERQHYVGLEDGRLEVAADRLARAAATITIRHELDTVISFGPDGFDGHGDHAATFAPVSLAASQLGLRHLVRTGADTSLSIDELSYGGDPRAKLAAMAQHRSQYDLSVADFWAGGMALYRQQLAVEQYALARP